MPEVTNRPVTRKIFGGVPAGHFDFRGGPKGKKFQKCQNYNVKLKGPSYIF
jgi:hypothetical protein